MHPAHTTTYVPGSVGAPGVKSTALGKRGGQVLIVGGFHVADECIGLRPWGVVSATVDVGDGVVARGDHVRE